MRRMSRKFIVISDDLTGANGIAGFMAHFCGSIVINYDSSLIRKDVTSLPYDCVVINTKSRMIDGLDAKNRVDSVLRLFSGDGYRFGKRIDSALRGNIEDEILPFIERGFMVVITDTIPEYGRYTYNGLTIIDNSTNNILAKFKYITPIIVGDIDELTNIENTTGKVFIVNSRTHDDLRRIANFIVNNQNVIPVDPLYLISYTAQQYINKPITTRAIIYKSIKRIAFVIGSTQEMTIKQINYASNNGFHAIKLNDLIMSKYTVNNDFIIIHFDYMRDKG